MLSFVTMQPMKRLKNPKSKSLNLSKAKTPNSKSRNKKTKALPRNNFLRGKIKGDSLIKIIYFCRPVVFWISVLLIFLGFAFFFTWPLLPNVTYAIIGQYDFTDGPFFLWNIWWVKKALLSFHNPFFSNYVYYPTNANLTFHTLTFTTALIALPLTFFFSLITSLNIILFASMVASAVGMVLLVSYLTKNKWAGIISGLIFAFNPYLFSHLWAGHYNLTMLWAFPYIALFTFKTIREKKIINPIFLALFLILQSYLDLQLAVFSFIIVISIFICFCLVAPREIFNKTTIFYFALTGTLYLFVFALPYGWWMSEFWKYRILLPTHNNGDLKIIFGANPLNPFIGKNNFELTKKLIGAYRENTIALGFSAMGLALLAFLFKKNIREKILFLVVAVVGIILSTGPYLQYNSFIYPIRLPFYYIAHLPVFDIGVVPSRFIVVTYFSLAVLAGLFFAGIFEFFRGKLSFLPYVLLILAVAAVSFEYYSGQMKMDFLPGSPILEEIKADAGDFTVLPFMARSRDGYYQTIYQKRMVSGFLGRHIHSVYLSQYFHKPLIGYFVSGSEDSSDLDVEAIRKTLKEYKVKYLIVDKSIDNKPGTEEVKNYLKKIGFGIWREDNVLAVYKVEN